MREKLMLCLILTILTGLVWGMTLVGSITGFRSPVRCVPNGNYAYMLDGENLTIIDISTPSSPSIIDTICYTSELLDLEIADTIGFLSVFNEIVVLNLSNPRAPVEIGRYRILTFWGNLAFKDGYLYAAAGMTFYIYDISFGVGGVTFTEVYSMTDSASVFASIDVDSIYLAVGFSDATGRDSRVNVYDITTPSSPISLGSISTSGNASEIDVCGSRVYIADGIGMGPVIAYYVYLIHNASCPDTFSTYSLMIGDPNHGCAHEDYYVLANGTSGLEVINWQTPTSPRKVDLYNVATHENFIEAYVQYPYIYATTNRSLRILHSDSLPYLGDRTPPKVRLLESIGGQHSACLHQRIAFLVTDIGGEVDWSTIRININGSIHDMISLSRTGDTVFYAPMLEWPLGDTINFSFLSVSDTAGNSALSLPITGSTLIDYEDPEIWGPEPSSGDTIDNCFPTITVYFTDRLSNIADFELEIGGRTYNITSPEMSYVGDTMTFLPTLPLPSGTVTICLKNVSDDVVYCGPNIAPDYCWDIFVIPDTSDTIDPVTTLLEPLPETFTSLPDKSIKILLEDESGLFLSSIELTVNSVNYILTSPELSFIDDTLIFISFSNYPEGSVTVSLKEYYDLVGNTGPPLDFTFYTDYTKPTSYNMYPLPGNNLTKDTVTIVFDLLDPKEGSGIDTSALQLFINDSLVIHDITVISDTFIRLSYFLDGSAYPSDTITLSLRNQKDMIDYGPPNEAPNLTYWFTIKHEQINESKKPETHSITVSPNPFNSIATIELILPAVETGELSIYDVKGNKIRTLFNGRTSGINTTFDAKDRNGKSKSICEILLIK